MNSSASLLLRPTGDLDTDACADLRQQLAAAFSAGVTSLVVDLAAVRSVDLTGLRVLAGAARHLRKRGGALVVTHMPPGVATLMRINGMQELLEVPATQGLRVVRGSGESTERPRERSLAVVRQDTGS